MHRRDLRASDADRERVAELLRGHAAVGRLTVDELDERTAAALSARTYGELDALLRDLPEAAPPARPPATPVKPPRWPGEAYFAETWRAPTTPGQTMTELLQHVAPPLHRHGYALVERTPMRLLFRRRRRPAWTILVAIFLFPFGLLALLYTEDEHIAIDLHPAGDGTLVSASGMAPLAVRRAFSMLEP